MPDALPTEDVAPESPEEAPETPETVPPPEVEPFAQESIAGAEMPMPEIPASASPPEAVALPDPEYDIVDPPTDPEPDPVFPPETPEVQTDVPSSDRNESAAPEPEPAPEPKVEKPKKQKKDPLGREWHPQDKFLAMCPPEVTRQRNYIISEVRQATIDGKKEDVYLRVGQCTGRDADHALDYAFPALVEATDDDSRRILMAVSERGWHPRPRSRRPNHGEGVRVMRK